MSVISTALTVTTSAQRIGTQNARRRYLAVHPPATGTVYIGGPTVSATSGVPLTAGDLPFEAFSVDTFAGEEWWVVVASGSSTVAVTEVLG